MSAEAWRAAGVWVGTILIPLAISGAGYVIQDSISQSSINKEYTAIAVGVLANPDADSEELRGWAWRLIDEISPVQLGEETRNRLMSDREASSAAIQSIARLLWHGEGFGGSYRYQDYYQGGVQQPQMASLDRDDTLEIAALMESYDQLGLGIESVRGTVVVPSSSPGLSLFASPSDPEQSFELEQSGVYSAWFEEESPISLGVVEREVEIVKALIRNEDGDLSPVWVVIKDQQDE